MQLTKNFHIDEFRCKDKGRTPVPEELFDNVKMLANNLQALRDHLNSETETEYIVSVMSGYRTVRHNKEVGGKENSYHLKALAGDIKVYQLIDNKKVYMPPTRVALTIETLIATGKMEQGGLGRYKKFTHYDSRGYRARWGKN